MRRLLCCCILLARNEDSHFRESIDHYQDCIMLVFSDKISSQVVQVIGFPWLKWNGKGYIQILYWIQWLGDDTNHACLDILIRTPLEWREIGIILEYCESFPLQNDLQFFWSVHPKWAYVYAHLEVHKVVLDCKESCPSCGSREKPTDLYEVVDTLRRI